MSLDARAFGGGYVGLRRIGRLTERCRFPTRRSDPVEDRAHSDRTRSSPVLRRRMVLPRRSQRRTPPDRPGRTHNRSRRQRSNPVLGLRTQPGRWHRCQSPRILRQRCRMHRCNMPPRLLHRPRTEVTRWRRHKYSQRHSCRRSMSRPRCRSWRNCLRRRSRVSRHSRPDPRRRHCRRNSLRHCRCLPHSRVDPRRHMPHT